MKDFFSSFPTIKYSQDGFNKGACNLSIGEVLLHNKIDGTYVMWKKELIEGDTPVSVSDEVYKSTEFYWTILFVNNIIDPFTQWYMTQTELENYTAKKYADPALPDGREKRFKAMDSLHHFEDASYNPPRVLDPVDHKRTLEVYNVNPLAIGENIMPVSNLIYEKRLNETRKVIHIISPKFIHQFVDNFNSMVKAT